MQETHDEGEQRAGEASDAWPYRVDAYPDEVVLLGGGWKDAIGHGILDRIVAQNRCANVIYWDKFELDELVFSQAAAILIMQGMLLQDFFPPDVLFQHVRCPRIVHRGPFFFLKGALSKPQDPPMRLKNVVLASVTEAPPDMPMEKLRGLLLEQIL